MSTDYMPFLDYARDNLTRWRYLMGRDVFRRDSDSRKGFVSKVFSPSGSEESHHHVMIRVCYGSKDVVDFTAEQFLQQHSFIDFPGKLMDEVFDGTPVLQIPPGFVRGEHDPESQSAHSTAPDSIGTRMLNQIFRNTRRKRRVTKNKLKMPDCRRIAVANNPAIYHMTKTKNLVSISRNGFLWCDKEMARRGLCPESIAYEDLKAKRRAKEISTGGSQQASGGTVLADYVPFYFCTRSPMLYTIHKGNVEGCSSQDDIIYLVTHFNRVQQISPDWLFTDGHAIEHETRFFTDSADLQQLDWDVISAAIWHDTPDDNSRKRRKQAEMLIHSFFPLIGIDQIATKDEATASKVREILQNTDYDIKVVTKRKWYY